MICVHILSAGIVCVLIDRVLKEVCLMTTETEVYVW